MEYLCLLAEIETLKEENALLRRKYAPKQQCPFITGKGTQCKRMCDGTSSTCKIHDRPAKVQVVSKLVCSGVNMRGNPCKRKCLEGQGHCDKHDPKMVKPVCSGVNMRGNPCKRKCLEGQGHCDKHDPSVKKKEKALTMHVEPLVPVDDKKWVNEAAFWIARNEPRMI